MTAPAAPSNAGREAAAQPPPAGGSGWRARLVSARWLRTPVLIFLATRLGIMAVAYVAVSVIPPASTIYHLRGTDNRLLDVFGSRWDTGFYVSIAEEGYRYQGVELPSVAFFPLQPVLMRGLMPIAGDAVVAGILISNLALLGALIVLHRLVLEEWGATVAERSVWYLAVFPASLFGSAIYTQSLFLLTAAGAYLLARRGHWMWAGLLGVAAALTRLHGLLVAVLLVGEWWRQWRSAQSTRPSLAALAAAAAAPLGTAAYMLYCWKSFGSPTAFATAASAWGRVPKPPFATIAAAVQPPPGGWLAGLLAGTIHVDNWIDLAAVLAFLALGCALLALNRWGEGLFVVLGVSLSFGSGLLMSQRRYMWVLFPAFVLLGVWGERLWLDRALTLVSALGLALFTALFAAGYWVG
jgi:Gpi18-like mannosyltransferase